MNYNNLIDIVGWNHIKPWEYDFYYALFHHAKSLQEFSDYAHEKTSDLSDWQIHVNGNSVYFAIPKAKNQTLPEYFSDDLIVIGNIPTDPALDEPTQE